MDERVKQLHEEKKRINKEIEQIWIDVCDKLTEDFKKGVIDEDELLLSTSDYVANTGDIEEMLRLLVSISNGKGLDLVKIKANLAERLYLIAKSHFLAVPHDDLGEALRLFKEINDEKKVKECEALFKIMFDVSESTSLD